MRPLALAPLMLLAACAPPLDDPLPIVPGTVIFEDADGVPLVGWFLSEWADGRAGLTLNDDAEATLFDIRCDPDGTIAVLVPGFTPVASNEEFALGTDRDSYLLVADVGDARGPGVAASGAIPAGLLDDIDAEGSLSALYGVQRIGPVTPPADLRARFTSACRAML